MPGGVDRHRIPRSGPSGVRESGRLRLGGRIARETSKRRVVMASATFSFVLALLLKAQTRP